ncbi:MAG: DUF1385 domain-containing protein [Lachnospiraceae bacterium]|nr:DUF1385 domain-containing protein [Lachnospiraceae bacterium]
MRKKKNRFSGIGGQAVLEGIMMKNQDTYAVAVRLPEGKIEVKKDEYLSHADTKWKKLPFIRGVFAFADSLILGMRALNISAEYYAAEEEEETTADKVGEKLFGDGAEKVLTTATMLFSFVVAIALFVVLPYFLAGAIAKVVANDSLLALFEGLLRLAIFLIYIVLITAMKDIRRVYQYHGAEHKCINCIEHGRILDVKNVKKSSRFHKRCGTSFLLFVMLISMILFFFIRVDQVFLRLLLRLAMIPVIAGISFEIIRLAGKSDNIFVNILSAPGMWLQRLTTKEPDEDMIEVAIAAVESVFDWKTYLMETFDFDVDAYLALQDDEEEAYADPDIEEAEEEAEPAYADAQDADDSAEAEEAAEPEEMQETTEGAKEQAGKEAKETGSRGSQKKGGRSGSRRNKNRKNR